MKMASQDMLKTIFIAMCNENKADCNENLRICAEESVGPVYKWYTSFRPVEMELSQLQI